MFVSVACVGVVGNSLAFWVWLGERHTSTTTLLFMYLAISDNVFLLFWSVVAVCYYRRDCSASLAEMGELGFYTWKCVVFLGRLSVSLSVHITALITINRWFAIWKPLHVHTMMSRRRVITLCALTSLWCVLLTIGVTLTSQGWDYMDMFYIMWFLSNGLPILVLVAFSASILWMIFKHRR
jgi:hypothetical protein